MLVGHETDSNGLLIISKPIWAPFDDSLLSDKNCVFGISETPTNGLVVKILHDKAEKLLLWMREMTKIIKQNGL